MSPKEFMNGPEPAQKAAEGAHGGQARLRAGVAAAEALGRLPAPIADAGTGAWTGWDLA